MLRRGLVLTLCATQTWSSSNFEEVQSHSPDGRSSQMLAGIIIRLVISFRVARQLPLGRFGPPRARTSLPGRAVRAPTTGTTTGGGPRRDHRGGGGGRGHGGSHRRSGGDSSGGGSNRGGGSHRRTGGGGSGGGNHARRSGPAIKGRRVVGVAYTIG